MVKDTYPLTECSTSVYVMEWGGKTKIGVARDPIQRLRQLQLANPGAIALVGHREFSSRLSAFAVERAMHRRFLAQRLLGEWFDVSAAKALAAIMDAPDPGKHHPHWNAAMPQALANAGIWARWKWHRDNDLVLGGLA